MEKQDWLEVNRPDTWRSIIETTQNQLFDPGYLFGMGDIYRREFAGECLEEGITIPSVPLDACRFAQAAELCTVRSGYDLPLLVTPTEDWNGRVIAFASQDPLRKGLHWPNSLSMSTPWGFSAQKVSSRGGKLVWPVVEWLCRKGYGAYFTDVWKLYVEPSTGVTRNTHTKQAEQNVFSREIAALNPDLWVAFGNDAYFALQGAGGLNIDRHPHPTAYGALKRHYQTADEKFSTIREAIIKQLGEKVL